MTQIHLVLDPEGLPIAAFEKQDHAARVAVSRQGHYVVSMEIQKTVKQCSETQRGTPASKYQLPKNIHCRHPQGHSGEHEFSK